MTDLRKATMIASFSSGSSPAPQSDASPLNRRGFVGTARVAAATGLLALLSACAGQAPSNEMTVSVAQEEAHYRAHAKSYYAPPGPPEDPWGPYIVEAAKRFDVPEQWIRAVMDRESGGRLYHNGSLVTSAPGAMGLMQLMPPTYDEMKEAYNLGDDPYDPHDSIQAGAAYIREMYDIYGSPGFLAAYNAGPGRLEDFLSRNRTLPRETRNYVSAIGRQIAGITPNNRSQADLLVASHESSANVAYASAAMPSGEAQAVRSAWAHREESQSDGNDNADQPVQVAEAPADNAPAAAAPAYTHAWTPVSRNPDSPQAVNAVWAARLKNQGAAPAAASVQVASADAASPASTPASDTPAAPEPAPQAAPVVERPSRRFQLVSPAMAEPAPLLSRSARSAGSRGAGAAVDADRSWAIQVGAFSTSAMAEQAASHARSHASSLSGARSQVASVKAPRGQLYRARLVGLTRADALAACRRLDASSGNCVVVSPDSAR
ncbi:lytic transglycosylase domain-containing protein [Acetobacter sacchari]|nr:lytic transglycosylase domain-containing protein [Acetobacter sacchari]